MRLMNPVDDFRLWNFVNNSFLAIDIVEIGLLGKTGNRIVYRGNGKWNYSYSLVSMGDNFFKKSLSFH